MRSLSLLFSVLCMMSMLLLAGCAKDEVALTGNIYGRITDAHTGEPVRAATVTLMPGGISTTTGGEGYFEFNELEPGQYTLQISKSGYQTDAKQITIVAGQTASGDKAITPETKNSVINLSTSTLNFGQNISILSFDIVNVGNAGTISYNVSGIASWMNVDPVNGTIDMGKSATVAVKVDRSGIEKAETAILRINAAGGSLPIVVSVEPPGSGTDPENPDNPDIPGNDVTDPLQTVKNGLYAYYRFEKSTGNSVNGAYSGTTVDCYNVDNEIDGTKALLLDSKDATFTVPEGLIDTRKMSISFWTKDLRDGHIFHVVKSTNEVNYKNAFALTMEGGQLKYIATSYSVFYEYNTRPAFNHSDISDGWHMITITSDFNNITFSTVTTSLYIDGVLTDVVTEYANPYTESEVGNKNQNYGAGIKFVLGGALNSAMGRSFIIDNLRVYNTRLISASEVAQIYEAEGRK